MSEKLYLEDLGQQHKYYRFYWHQKASFNTLKKYSELKFANIYKKIWEEEQNNSSVEMKRLLEGFENFISKLLLGDKVFSNYSLSSISKK